MFLFKQCLRVRPLIPHYADNCLEDIDRKWIRKHINHCQSCESRLTQHRSQLATLATLGFDDLLRVRLELEAELAPTTRLSRHVLALIMLGLCLFFLYGASLILVDWLHPNPKLSSDANLITVLSADSPVMPEKTINPGITPTENQAPETNEVTASTILAQIPVPKPQTPNPAPPVRPKTPAAKVQVIPKPAPPKIPAVYTYPRLILLSKTPDRSPNSPPKAIAEVLARLGVENGFRYGEMLFFPIVDNTENDKTRLKASRLPYNYVEELSPPFPSKLVASRVMRRESWPFTQGLMLEAPWGWRIVRNGPLSMRENSALISVISISDPDVLFLERLGTRYKRFRRKQLPVPPMAPSRVRRALILEESNGHVRRALWDSFLNGSDVVARNSKDPFVPADSLKSQKLARALKIRRLAIETEITELNRRLRHIFVAMKGLRGIAMSMGEKTYSLDIFPDANRTLRALPSLVQGLALDAFESSLYTPLSGSGRALLKERTETTDIHRLLLGLTRNLKGSPEDGYKYIHKERGLKSAFRLTLESKKRISHLVILKDR
ncbi:MAG: hypothetical protein P1V97_08405 [Planctomycetota bacterium]|nr:hypothetical protein [Planctomycetota bacterium]